MERGILLTSLLGIIIAAGALAQDHPEHPKKQPVPAQVIAATVVGENVCLGCALKKKHGAAAQCSKYGHRHALKVTAATAGSKKLPEMNGWVLHYLDTDTGQPVIKEHHNEMLTLKGTVYSDLRVLEVDTLVQGKKPEHPEHPKQSDHPEHPKKSEHPEHPKR